MTVILNNNLHIFPFTSYNYEVKHYTLYAAVNDKGAPLGVFINGAKMRAEEDVFNMEMDYELWYINLMPVAHPMHVHLVNFQVYKRVPFDKNRYTTDWLAANAGKPPYTSAVNVLDPEPYFTGPWENLGGVHRVWRDMVDVGIDLVVVTRMRFMYNTGKRYQPDVRGSRYVMHCHILEHEDNDMMRYFSVV